MMIRNLSLIIFFIGIQCIHSQIHEGKDVVSSIYIYDLEKKQPIKLKTIERHLEAPNWSVDNKFLLITLFYYHLLISYK